MTDGRGIFCLQTSVQRSLKYSLWHIHMQASNAQASLAGCKPRVTAQLPPNCQGNQLRGSLQAVLTVSTVWLATTLTAWQSGHGCEFITVL
jgi:hypothetical protein